MPKYRFDWASLPGGLLRQLQRDLKLGGSDPAKALRRAFGARPSEEFVKQAWGSLRGHWVAKDPVVRKSIVADLRAKALGRMDVRVGTARGEIAYLRSCRNSPTLRSVVLAHLLAVGEELRSPKTPATDKATNRDPSGIGSTDAWRSLAEALAVTLAQLELDQFLVLRVRDSPCHYIQFAQQGPAGLRAETASNASLEEWERLDDDAQAQLLAIGWQAPTPPSANSGDSGGSPNYSCEWVLPVPYRDIARLAVRTLREVLEVRHPGLLAYKAFARGGTEVILPNLGLVRETSKLEPPATITGTAQP